MSGSGRAGNGRGNNRRHSFRWRSNDAWRENENNSVNDVPGKFTGGSEGTNNFYKNDETRANAQRNKRPEEQEGSSRGGFRPAEFQGRQNRGAFSRKDSESVRGRLPENRRAPVAERPKWIPPVMNTEPLPVPDCPVCGRPIRDICQAIADKDTGVPVHFDCAAAEVTARESLEKGDTITYIGGGRFGIVSFGNSGESGKDASRESVRDPSRLRYPASVSREFKIKKIIEWENKDKRAEWRSEISDHYSVT